MDIQNRLKKWRSLLVRKEEMKHCGLAISSSSIPGEHYLQEHAIVTHRKLPEFYTDMQDFLIDLSDFLQKAKNLNFLPPQKIWEKNALRANRDYPSFKELSTSIRTIVSLYEKQRISPERVYEKIHRLISSY